MDDRRSSFDRLNAEQVIKTIKTLGDRVEERFPTRNLVGVCHELQRLAETCARDAALIGRPNWSLRLLSALGFVAVVAGLMLLTSLLGTNIPGDSEEYAPFSLVQGLEAAFNIVALAFFGVLFLSRLEERAKRHRAYKSLHQLRSITHVIDMHQLTKDPGNVLHGMAPTKSSPQRELKPGELARYLDYCTEMLSLTGKIAALYAQNSRDPQIVAAANDIEDLTTGLSRKIWQKLIILQHYAPEETKAGPSSSPPLAPAEDV